MQRFRMATSALCILSAVKIAFGTISLVADEPTDIAFWSRVDKSEQRYVEVLPKDFQKEHPHDVVIALHGHGSDRWQFVQLPRDECRGVRDVASKYKMILVSPDYRAKTSWMGPLAEDDMLQIIEDVRRRHRVGRVFVSGGSMGGTSALIFAALHPELIAGVCSLNGTANMVEYGQFQDAIQASYGGTKTEAPEEYRKRSAEFAADRLDMPIAVTTAGLDTLVPPESTLRLVDALKQSGRKVLSIHREKGGHETNYEDTCAAMEFMIQQARKESP